MKPVVTVALLCASWLSLLSLHCINCSQWTSLKAYNEKKASNTNSQALSKTQTALMQTALGVCGGSMKNAKNAVSVCQPLMTNSQLVNCQLNGTLYFLDAWEALNPEDPVSGRALITFNECLKAFCVKGTTESACDLWYMVSDMDWECQWDKAVREDNPTQYLNTLWQSLCEKCGETPRHRCRISLN